MNKIDPTLFHIHDKTHSEFCPLCAEPLVLRQGKRGLFKACSGYPACTYLDSLSQQDGHVVKTLEQPCPSCHEALVLRRGRFGMFIGCSAYPACSHIEKRSLEQGDDDLACPECHKGYLQARTSRFGKKFFACSAYPKCKFSINLKPIAGVCQICCYPLLVEKSTMDPPRYFCANRKCAQVQADASRHSE